MNRILEFPEDIRPDFHGFPLKGFDFLSALKENNNRQWFKERKECYEAELKFPMECLLAEFTQARKPKNFPVQGDPKRGMFRIYRDIRFSKDKLPYKTHAGAIMSRSGAKGEPGLIYIHIQPKNSFLSAGFYSPDKNFLTAWRHKLVSAPDVFLELIKPFSKPTAKYFLRQRGSLKTMPRGFAEHAESPVAEFVKWKHFLIGQKITDKQAQDRKLIKEIKEFVKVSEQFLQFGWNIYETAYKSDPRQHMRNVKTSVI